MFWKRKDQGFTIFFCSDIHGSTVCFKKFLNAAKYYRGKGQRVDALILGGDITGKLIVPIIKEGEAYRSYLFGRPLTLSSRAEVADLVRKAEALGAYSYIFEPDEYQAFKDSPEKQNALFRQLMLRRLEEWMQLAMDKMKDGSIPCYISPGNDDIDEVTALLQACPVITCPDQQVVQLGDDYEMISLGYANLTPFGCPRDVPEEELARRIDELAARIKDVPNCVFNLHCPPFGARIDEAPLLDAELRPQIGMTGVEMAAAGCQAVRSAIEKYQPLLGLHGHIHESKGATKLGRTLCVNPGSEYSEGILRGVLVTLGKREVLTHMFTSG